MPDGLPDNQGTNREIPMDHFVPHSREFSPGNFRVPFDNLRRIFFIASPMTTKLKNNRLAGLPVAKQLLV